MKANIRTKKLGLTDCNQRRGYFLRLWKRFLLGCIAVLLSVPAAADPNQDFERGLRAHAQGAFDEALKAWISAADAGHRAASYNVGVLFEQGRGTPVDLSAAAQWYLKAAQRGVLEAQWAVARLYESGQGLQRNAAQARWWLETLARQAPTTDADRQLVAQAQQRLLSLPEPGVEEVPFEGGRFLLRESTTSQCVIALQGFISEHTRRGFARVAQRSKAAGCKEVWLLLESPGGSLRAGIELGEELYSEGYSTIVNRSCASACALIFMAGRQRVLMGRTARIGLHQTGTSDPRFDDTSKDCHASALDESSRLKRRYLSRVLPNHWEPIFERTMKTSCNAITWVRGSEAVGMGIATQLQ